MRARPISVRVLVRDDPGGGGLCLTGNHRVGVYDFDPMDDGTRVADLAGGVFRSSTRYSTDVVFRRTESQRPYEHSPCWM